MSIENWIAINKANWESRVAVHTGPNGYDLDAFDDPTHITDVVRYDLARLGCLDGLDVVHLQCHVGTDTVSLARLGAASVTGVDFSPSALAVGRTLADRAGNAVTFVDSDVYGAPQALGGVQFDLVYTGIGAICWLDNIARWGQVVSALLKPGGRLFIREGHPMAWALSDPRTDGLLVVEFPYFETEGVPFSKDTSYAGDGKLSAPEMVHFNHGLGEIFNALWEAGLQITAFEEHRELPWAAFPDAMGPSPRHSGEFVMLDAPERLPLSYTLVATKPG